MKNLLFSLSVLVALFLTSCMSNETANSDTVKQTEIYQNYSVNYDEADKELDVSAQFRFGGNGGTTLQLVSPAYIKYNGDDMQLSNNFIRGTFYETDMQTEFIGVHEWVYTDCDEKVFKNKVKMFRAELVNLPKEMSKKEGLTFTWKGPPVQENEEVSVILETADNVFKEIDSSVQGVKQLTIAPEDLAEIQPGPATLKIKREVDKSLDEGEHLGGSISAEFVSKEITITIVE